MMTTCVAASDNKVGTDSSQFSMYIMMGTWLLMYGSVSLSM